MIQPGAFGDIIICAPIAKWYADAGYDVYWPAREKFLHKMIEPLGYVHPILLDERVLHEDWLRSDVIKCLEIAGQYDYVLNLADRGPHPTAELPGEGFEKAKYRIANVPFEEKYTFMWNRDHVKENYVYDLYVNLPGHEKYAFVHNTSSDLKIVDLPNIDLPVVICEDFNPDYNIYDWWKVIANAEEIYVTESSIWAFCDGILDDITENRYIIDRDMRGCNTVSSHWRRLTSE